MSSLHPARRGAERFSSLLDNEREAVRDPRDLALLELVDALQAVERVEARPAFVADLRERLILAAEAEFVVPDSPAALTERLTVRARRTPRERRLAVALGGFAIVGATTSMAVAAQSAIPGDVLYPVKRAMENAETGLSVTDEAKGSTILANAAGRLDEIGELTNEDDVDAVAVAETLGTFAEQATEASELLMADYTATGSEDSINEVRDFASTSIEELAALEEVIPEEAEEALLNAAQVLFEIDTLAASLCPECESLGITEIPMPLLASGDTQLDDAAVAVAVAADTAEGRGETGLGDKPDQGDKGPVANATETVGADPLQLPTQGTDDGDGNSNGSGNGQPQNPLGTGGVSVPSSLPSLEVPEVDQVVSDMVEGVDDIVGDIAGTK